MNLPDECHRCGFPNPSYARFCRRCGWPFGNLTRSKTEPKIAPLWKQVLSRQRYRKQRNIAIACFIVIATLTTGSCYMIMNSDDPSDRQEFLFWLGVAVVMALALLAKALYDRYQHGSP